MKFSCEKYVLAQAVSAAGRAASSKSTIPALEGLLLEVSQNNRVTVTGYDLKRGIYTSFDADVFMPGSVVLNARLFVDIVRNLPDGVVTITADEYNSVAIHCVNADYSLSGTSAEDYPELPSLDHGSSVIIGQKEFSDMISQTAFAISNNESRPVYTGALIEVEGGVLTMVTVDGYRLALRKEEIVSGEADKLSVIVPGAALSDLAKICSGSEQNVQITVGSKHVSFTVGDTVIISRRLEGEFLNYRKTVPYDYEVKVTAERTDLIRCADRVSLIVDEHSKNPLRCEFGSGTLTIRCSTPLGSAVDSCSIEGDGKGLVIGFNNSYLLDALKAAPADRLSVNLGNGSSPCVIKPEDGSEKFLYMILPVRLRAGE
jgi:DNA polymerase-3 subunit beta